MYAGEGAEKRRLLEEGHGGGNGGGVQTSKLFTFGAVLVLLCSLVTMSFVILNEVRFQKQVETDKAAPANNFLETFPVGQTQQTKKGNVVGFCGDDPTSTSALCGSIGVDEMFMPDYNPVPIPSEFEGASVVQSSTALLAADVVAYAFMTNNSQVGVLIIPFWDALYAMGETNFVVPTPENAQFERLISVTSALPQVPPRTSHPTLALILSLVTTGVNGSSLTFIGATLAFNETSYQVSASFGDPLYFQTPNPDDVAYINPNTFTITPFSSTSADQAVNIATFTNGASNPCASLGIGVTQAQTTPVLALLQTTFNMGNWPRCQQGLASCVIPSKSQLVLLQQTYAGLYSVNATGAITYLSNDRVLPYYSNYNDDETTSTVWAVNEDCSKFVGYTFNPNTALVLYTTVTYNSTSGQLSSGITSTFPYRAMLPASAAFFTSAFSTAGKNNKRSILVFTDPDSGLNKLSQVTWIDEPFTYVYENNTEISSRQWPIAGPAYTLTSSKDVVVLPWWYSQSAIALYSDPTSIAAYWSVLTIGDALFYAGIAQSDGKEGDSVEVLIQGVSHVHSGLQPGFPYYAAQDGSLTAGVWSPGSTPFVGIALSETSLLLSSDLLAQPTVPSPTAPNLNE